MDILEEDKMDELNYAIDMLVERQGLLSDYGSINLSSLNDNNTLYFILAFTLYFCTKL